MIWLPVRKTAIVECAACPALVIAKTQADAIAGWNRRDDHTLQRQLTALSSELSAERIKREAAERRSAMFLEHWTKLVEAHHRTDA